MDKNTKHTFCKTNLRGEKKEELEERKIRRGRREVGEGRKQIQGIRWMISPRDIRFTLSKLRPKEAGGPAQGHAACQWKS